MSVVLDKLLRLLDTFWLEVTAFAPRIFVAGLLLIGGWIAAKILRRAVIRFLRLVHLDTAAERAGIEDFLLQGGVRMTAVTLFANLIYWFILLTVILLPRREQGGLAGEP